VGRRQHWRGLGLDTENMLSTERATRLAGEILTPWEMQQMADRPAEQIALHVTLTFSIKEALFKALYPIVQKRFYFHEAELLQWSADGKARLRLLTDLSAEWHTGKELDGQFSVQGEHVLSLVAVPA
jgi:enterobactin synthetase component D